MGDTEPDLWNRNPCFDGGGADAAEAVVVVEVDIVD